MSLDKLHDLRSYLDLLKKEQQLLIIEEEVDPYLEIAEIHRRIIAREGPALLFTQVKGSKFPVTTNLFGNAKRLELAFGNKPQQFVRDIVRLAESIMPFSIANLWKNRQFFLDGLKIGLKTVAGGPILENCQQPPQLSSLPMLTSWHSDGGPFVTLPLVYTEHPGGRGHNLGMYRIHKYDDARTGIHWQIHKGGGYHYYEAEKQNKPLPLSLFIGGPPALMLSAIAPLPEDIPELMLTSLLIGDKLHMTRDPLGGHNLIANVEFAIKGHVPPHLRHPEGPFGDHYGYDSLQHNYPVFQVSHLYHRRDAIYPATVVGRPRQEDFFIGDFLQELLSPLFPLVMKGVKELKTFGETGFHCLAAAKVSDRYPREAFACGLRILGEGQLSLTKFLIITDGDIDITDFSKLWVHVLERIQWEQDLFVFANVSQDTLDYTGPSVNKGSKAMLMGLGKEKIRDLPRHFSASLPDSCTQPNVFMPGTLVIQGRSYNELPALAKELSEDAALQEWPVIMLVDNSIETTSSMQDFLWTIFTRFEPAADIHACSTSVHRFHVALQPPVVFDCRMKPWYTKILEVDRTTKDLVDGKFTRIIPAQWR
ncbi:MAG: UbiD family decarboxylase [Pseudomonadota bacterium]